MGPGHYSLYGLTACRPSTSQFIRLILALISLSSQALRCHCLLGCLLLSSIVPACHLKGMSC